MVLVAYETRGGSLDTRFDCSNLADVSVKCTCLLLRTKIIAVQHSSLTYPFHSLCTVTGSSINGISHYTLYTA